MNPKEKDNEIIELTDEELDEIFADDDFDNGEEDGEISFHFSNPDPYAKVKPRPDDAPKREFSFDEKDNIVDERFAIMSKNYTEEQKDLKAEVKGLQ